jgi:hypothetical protein
MITVCEGYERQSTAGGNRKVKVKGLATDWEVGRMGFI